MIASLTKISSVKLVRWASLLSVLLFWVTSVSAENGAEAFNAANRLYEQQKFPAAMDEYQKLIQGTNISAAVYFNLGNASFKTGQIGRAIAAYRNAQTLAPRDPDIRANLQFARKEANSKVSDSLWQQWINRFTLNEWTIATVILIWIFFGLLIIGQWRPAFKKVLRLWSVLIGAAVLFLGICLGAATYDHLYTRPAVVVVPEAVVRRGPFEESQSYFTLHDGAEVWVVDKKDKWLQVAESTGRTGWLPESQVIVLNGRR